VDKGKGRVPLQLGIVPDAVPAWTSPTDGSEISLSVRAGSSATGRLGLREVEFGFEGAYPDRTWRWDSSEGAWEVEDRGVESTKRSISALPETGCTSILRALRGSSRDATPVEAMCLARQFGEGWFG
jgi:hypothetical protein